MTQVGEFRNPGLLIAMVSRDPGLSWPVFVRYGIAVALTGAALGVCVLTLPPGEYLVFVALYPAVALSALLLGAGPGILAMLVGAIGTDYIFFAPYFSLIYKPNHAFALGLFGISGAIMCWITHQWRSAVAELAEARREQDALIDNVPARISSWNAELVNRIANRQVEERFSLPAGGSRGLHMREIIGEERFLATTPYVRAALRGERQWREYTESGPDGSVRNVRVEHVPDRRDGAIVGLYTLVTDVTELRAVQDRLRESEAHFRELATAASMGICVMDRGEHCTYANPAAKRIAGLPDGAALGHGWRQLLSAPDLDLLRSLWAGQPDTASDRAVSIRLRRPSGEIRWVRCRGGVMPDPHGGEARYLATFEDVTDLQDSYERIRELAQRLESVREEERRSVALLLHEGIAQDLFAAQLSLRHLEAQARGRSGVTQACQELTLAINRCMEALRTLANDLRPAALADMRLAVALAQHAESFGKRAGLRVTVKEVAPFPTVSEPIRLVLFRAAQEALTNVARHAAAQVVGIELSADAREVAMEITDDGVGIEDAELTKTGSLGLIGMRERLAALGGSLSVRRRGAAGTSVLMRLPFAAD